MLSAEHGEEHIDLTGGADKTKLLAADYLDYSRDEWEVVDHSVGPTLCDDHKTESKDLYFYTTSSPG